MSYFVLINMFLECVYQLMVDFFPVQHGGRCFKILHFSRICKFVT